MLGRPFSFSLKNIEYLPRVFFFFLEVNFYLKNCCFSFFGPHCQSAFGSMPVSVTPVTCLVL